MRAKECAYILILRLAVFSFRVRCAENAGFRHHGSLDRVDECNGNIFVLVSVAHKQANVSHSVFLPSTTACFPPHSGSWSRHSKPKSIGVSGYPGTLTTPDGYVTSHCGGLEPGMRRLFGRNLYVNTVLVRATT